jgi:hypothetical protein
MENMETEILYVNVSGKEDTKLPLFVAFHNVVANVSNPKKIGKNPHFKSNYSRLEDVLAVLEQPLEENGLVVSQSWKTEYIANTPVKMVMYNRIMGKSGDYLILPTDFPIAQATPNGQASSITYLRRYSLMCIFGLTGEDDDGAAGSGLKATSAQPQRTSPPAQRPTNQRR